MRPASRPARCSASSTCCARHLKEKPDYIAFVVDAPGRTFRDDSIQTTRPTARRCRTTCARRSSRCCAIVAALGLPILRVDGVEADDVIGTLAVQGAAAGIDVTISTGDKDMAQLVRPGMWRWSTR
jgi:DNA polymerase-1